MTNRSSCEIWSRGQQTGHDYLEASLDDHQADKLDHRIDHHSDTTTWAHLWLIIRSFSFWSQSFGDHLNRGGQEEDPTGWLVRSKYTIHDCRSLSANFCALCPSLRFSILKRLLTDKCLEGCSQCSRSKA